MGVFVIWESPAKRMGEIWGGSRKKEQGGNHCFHKAVFLLKGSVPAPVALKNVSI